MTTPTTFADEVLGELRALHWGSHAKGATIPEIVAALRIRKVPGSEADDAFAAVTRALDAATDRWALHPNRLKRDDRYAIVPIEPAFA